MEKVCLSNVGFGQASPRKTQINFIDPVMTLSGTWQDIPDWIFTNQRWHHERDRHPWLVLTESGINPWDINETRSQQDCFPITADGDADH